MSYYSQNDEEKIIVDHFNGRVGSFLDIGAFDGIGFSNTRRLMELGWSGLCVEPSPENVVALIKNLQPFSGKVKILQAAVSDYNGISPLFIDRTEDRKWAATVNDELIASGSVRDPQKVVVLCLIIMASSIPYMGLYDFINIDAEWEDERILMNLLANGAVGKCSMICIECKNEDQRKLFKDVMYSNAWVHKHDTRENAIFVRP